MSSDIGFSLNDGFTSLNFKIKFVTRFSVKSRYCDSFRESKRMNIQVQNSNCKYNNVLVATKLVSFRPSAGNGENIFKLAEFSGMFASEGEDDGAPTVNVFENFASIVNNWSL